MVRQAVIIMFVALAAMAAGAVRAVDAVPSPVGASQETSSVADGPGEEIPADTIDEEAAGDEEEVSAPEECTTGMQPERHAARKAVYEAEMLYREAVRSYENGNSVRAGKLYADALAKLAAAGVDADVHYRLKDDYYTIFGKLDEYFCSTATASNVYTIPMDTDNELVQKYLKLYTSGAPREIIRKALERSGRYRDMVLSVLREYDLPEELVYLPVVESLYNNNDLSRAGALGIWQLMPQRARALGLKVNYWIDERKDPVKSTRAAARYLKQLYVMFDDWHLALAAYNRGEYGLVRDLKFSNATNIEEISQRRAVPRETEQYVPQFIACALIGSTPEKYGFDHLTYEQPIRADMVAIGNIVDLKIAAKCAESTVAVIRELNPALKAWCTPHNYPDYSLCLPEGTKDIFLANIAKEKDLNPSRGYIKYRVGKGDSLSKIAKKFHTTPDAIREDNRIKDPRHLRVSQTLVIRPGRKYLAE